VINPKLPSQSSATYLTKMILIGSRTKSRIIPTENVSMNSFNLFILHYPNPSNCSLDSSVLAQTTPA